MGKRTKFLIISLLLLANFVFLATSSNITRSSTKTMSTAYIRITKIQVTNDFYGTSSTLYEFKFATEFKRLFTDYGDRLINDDGQYNDYTAGYYDYPDRVNGAYEGTLTKDQNLPTSYTIPLSGSGYEFYLSIRLNRIGGVYYTNGFYLGSSDYLYNHEYTTCSISRHGGTYSISYMFLLT